jgi:hypothetical protein
MSASFRLSIKHRRALRGIFDEAGNNHGIDDSIAILAGAADRCWRALQKGGTPAIVGANRSIAMLRGLERVWEDCEGYGGCEDIEVGYITPYEKIHDRAVRDIWHSKKKVNKAIRQLAKDVGTEWGRVTCLPLPRPVEPSGQEYWDATNQSPNLLWLMLDAVGINVGWRAVCLLVSCSQYRSIEEALL